MANDACDTARCHATKLFLPGFFRRLFRETSQPRVLETSRMALITSSVSESGHRCSSAADMKVPSRPENSLDPQPPMNTDKRRFQIFGPRVSRFRVCTPPRFDLNEPCYDEVACLKSPEGRPCV